MSVAIYLVVIIIVRALIAWWCVEEAKKKGRDTLTAGLLGFFFGLWAAIGYALLKSKINPQCLKCKAPTTLRTVLNGKDEGKKFYVCSNYPQCNWRIKA